MSDDKHQDRRRDSAAGAPADLPAAAPSSTAGDADRPTEYRPARLAHQAATPDASPTTSLAPGGRPAPTDESPPIPPESPPDVPGYELLRPLGRGGMGVVYLARQTALKRLVALKMILGHRQNDAGERARFRAEAEAAARLGHPGLVQVYEVGEANGIPYLALEYVVGGSLHQRLSDGPWKAGPAAALVAKLASAVQCAHDAGVVHRDLKPANVLLDGSDAPKITDFGLAKRVDDLSGLTQSGMILGTPSYMAPEQARADAANVGPAADIYSLGAILYELLVGRPPFRGATVLDTLRQVCEQEPLPPRRFDTSLPRDLETICLKCLDKAPRRRYARAADLADDLARYLAGHPIAARPVGRLERAGKWARREPWLAGISAALAVVVVVALTVVSWQLSATRESARQLGVALGERTSALTAQQQATKQAQESRTLEQTARENAERQTALKNVELDRAERMVYANVLARVYREWRGDDVGRAAQLLDDAQASRRDWEWRFLRRQTMSTTLEYSDHPDGYLASYRKDGGQLLVQRPRGVAHFDAHHDVHLWDFAQARRVLAVPGYCAAFSADHRLLAVLAPGPGRLRSLALLYDTATGAVVRTCAGDLGFAAGVAFDPTDRELLAVDMQGGLRAWDVATGAELRRFDQPGRMILQPPFPILGEICIFSPDRKRVALSNGQLLDTTTGARVANLEPFATGAFSPDGTRFASAPTANAGGGLTAVGCRLMDAATGAVSHTLALAPPHVRRFIPASRIVFSPDGRLVAAATGSIGMTLGFLGETIVWDAAGGEERLRFSPGTHAVTAVAFSPDGSTLAVGGESGVVELRDVAGGRVRRTLRVSPGRAITDLQFAPDGNSLAATSCHPFGIVLQDDARTTIWDLRPGVEADRYELPVTERRPREPDFSGEAVVPSVRLRIAPDNRRILWNGLDAFGRARRPATVTIAADRPLTSGETPPRGEGDVARGEWLEDVELPELDGRFRLVGRQYDQKVQGPTPGRLVVDAEPDGQETSLLVEGEWNVQSASRGADGRTLAAVLGRAIVWRTAPPLGMTVQVWSSAAPHEKFKITDDEAVGGRIALSADGSRVAFVKEYRNAPHRLEVWEVAPPRLVHRLEVGRGVTAAGLSADGRRVAVANVRGAVTAWNLETEPRPVAMLGHLGRLHALTFSPDGQRLATAGEDLVVRLWDTTTGQELMALPGPSDLIMNVAFSPDGRLLAANDRQGRLWIWNGGPLAEPPFVSWPTSLEELDRQAAAGRDDAELWRQRATWHVRRAEWLRAAECSAQAAERESESVDAWKVAAEHASIARRWDLAENAYSHLLTLAPDRPEYWSGRAEARARRGMYRQAADDQRRGESLVGNNLEGKCTLAGLLLLADDERGYREVAEQAIRQALDSGWIGPRHPNAPRNAYLLARLASYVRRSDDPARSGEWARQAVSASPGLPWYLHVEGLARLRAGDERLACESLQQSATADPGWCPPLNRLALALCRHLAAADDMTRRDLIRAAADADGWMQSEGSRDRSEQGGGPNERRPDFAVGVGSRRVIQSEPTWHLHDLIGLALLRREAAEVLARTGVPPR